MWWPFDAKDAPAFWLIAQLEIEVTSEQTESNKVQQHTEQRASIMCRDSTDKLQGLNHYERGGGVLLNVPIAHRHRDAQTQNYTSSVI